MQSKVYGAGYPSLPLMSVEEFYEQKYKEEVEQRYNLEVDSKRSLAKEGEYLTSVVTGYLLI